MQFASGDMADVCFVQLTGVEVDVRVDPAAEVVGDAQSLDKFPGIGSPPWPSSPTSSSSPLIPWHPVLPPTRPPVSPSGPPFPLSSDSPCSTATTRTSGEPLPACRICMEEEGELIVPCLCSGTSLWIHRRCLDDWRAVNVGRDDFRRCPTCLHPYAYEPPLIHPSALRTCQYRLLLVRDLLCVVALIQCWLIGLAAVIGGIDAGCGQPMTGRLTSIPPYPLFYLLSVLVSLALFGLFGLLARSTRLEERLLLGGQQRQWRSASGEPTPVDCICPGAWVCSEGDGVVVLLLLLLVLLATVGLLYGLVYGSALLRVLLKRHIQCGWNRSETDKFRVVDWSHDPAGLRQ